MKKRYLLVGILMSLCVALAAQDKKQAEYTPLPQKLELSEQMKAAIDSCKQYARSVQSKFTIPGMQITAMIGEDVVLSDMVGYRNLTKEQPMLHYYKMRIASISKMFTSVGVMKLVEMGLVSPDSLIQAYVPDFPTKAYPVTVLHLLNHTSGIRHYMYNEFNNPKKYKTIEQALDYFKNDTLMFEPGTKVLYSSYAYNLLGVMIEKVMKMPYKDYIYEHLLFPIGLKYTIPDQVGNFIKNKSKFYYLDPNNIIRDTKENDISYKLPTGGYLSTSYEVAKFASELMAGKIISPKTLELYLSPTFLKDKENTFWNYGLKHTQIDRNTKVYWQMGSTYGGCSAVAFEPNSKIAICWLNNMSVKWKEEEILQLMKYLLDAKKAEKKK